MAFKKRRDADERKPPRERTISARLGYSDLAGVLGEHTLDAEQEAAAIAPKGYRARSVAKEGKPPRR